MASRSKRAGTATPQPQPTGSSTPLNVGAAPSSPLSPTRHSRLAEKAELQNLNDRLACYIDRVRNLETENARLNIEVKATRDTVTRETTNIKSIYETELADARRLLDETSREKAKLEIDIKRMYEENDELRAKLDKKVKDCAFAEGNARMYETRFADLSGKYNNANADRKKAQDDLNDLQKEFERLSRQLDETRKHLEEETLARVDLENTIQSLREELTFKDQVHTQEISETRTRRQEELSEIDGRLTEEYEAKLQQSLQELREQYDHDMRVNRQEIENLYQQKIKALQSAANRNTNLSSNVVEELRTARTRIEGLNGRLQELEKVNTALNARVRELEHQQDVDRARHGAELAAMEAELQRMREEMAQQLQEYQDLMDIKVSLDLEIAAYDKLLQGEESRLNLTPSNSATVSSLSQSFRSGRRTPVRKTPMRSSSSLAPGIKRKRTIDESEDISQAEYFVSSTAKGDVQIVEIDGDGKFVKLHNKGEKELSIGSWQLKNSVGSNSTTFKFNRSLKIAAGATITVWSSDTNASHEPPNNIVMKQQKWVVGENTKMSLINNEGEEVAASERVKRLIATHVSRHIRSATGGISGGIGEELYHQQGDPQTVNEKCRLM